jgi:type II secretory pathway component PulL
MIVRRGPGLLGTMARTAVVAGTASAVVGGMSRHQQARAQQEAQAQAYQQQQAQQYAPPAPEPPTAADLTTRLKELADLKAAGAITDEEFSAAKGKLLGI